MADLVYILMNSGLGYFPQHPWQHSLISDLSIIAVFSCLFLMAIIAIRFSTCYHPWQTAYPSPLPLFKLDCLWVVAAFVEFFLDSG